MAKILNIGLVGTKFMGKAHSSALRTMPHFFDPGARLVLKVICGLNDDLAVLAKKYGWQSYVNDWRKVASDPEIDLVVIASPGSTHAEIAIAAANHGKHILCEKPLALSCLEAKEMLDAVHQNKVKHMVNFNYRRVPAIMLAKRSIELGKLDTVYHFRSTYQQGWAADPNVPFLWRFDKNIAGAGSMADKGSHIVDLARYLIGEISEVSALSDIFIRERESLYKDGETKEVTTDDVAMFLARFDNGAVGIFETSRIAVGSKNALQFEINGSKGCIRFNLERLNELEVFFTNDDRSFQGFRNILVTDPEHDYMDKWWPTGHILGWEHAFSHQYYEFIKALVEDYLPQPNFYDGLKTQRIIEAVETASNEKTWVAI